MQNKDLKNRKTGKKIVMFFNYEITKPQHLNFLVNKEFKRLSKHLASSIRQGNSSMVNDKPEKWMKNL